MINKNNYTANNSIQWISTDTTLITSVVLLLSIGVVMVTSSSIAVADKQLGDPFYFSKRHIVYVVMSLLLIFSISKIRLVYWEKAGGILAVTALFLLFIVLLPGLGRTVNGATRWLDLGVFSLQVSELARLFLFIYLAGYLVRKNSELRSSFMGFVKPMLVLGVASIGILAQPDFGACVVLLSTALGMMFIAGVRFGQFFSLLLVLLSSFVILALTSPYRVKRLTAFLDPWADPFNTGFQLTQSLIAFGSGGWSGVGLGNSVQKLFYLPEAHNDFLLAILAEELGFLGVFIMLLLFILLVWKTFNIGYLAKSNGDHFGGYLSFGIGLWIAIQATINVGVNMGVLPTKGLTLPFVSSGGTSLLVMCMGIGIVLRINTELKLSQAQALRKVKTTQNRKKKNRTHAKK